MAQIAAAGGIWLAVNQDCRYNPASYTVKQLLAPARLGRPITIEVQNYWRGDPKPFDHTGAWMQHMVHHADLIRWWVGEPCVSVYAKAASRSTMTIYEFADGILVYHMENHTGVEHHDTRIRVTAEKGVIRAKHNWNWHYGSAKGLEFVEVFRHTKEPPVALPLPEHVYEPPWTGINKWIPSSGPYYDLAGPIAGMMGSMGALMRGVETQSPPDNHVDGAIASLRMCLAAELSVKLGQPVDPREVPSDTATVN
jgi:predicted dehydrogenase